MDFRERYKRIGFGRENVEINRMFRSQRQDKVRRDIRSKHFNLKRGMNCNVDDSLEREECDKKNGSVTKTRNSSEEPKKNTVKDLKTVVQKRRLQLEKWREERNRQRNLKKKEAKPVFKVGVVHHRVYSPPLTKNLNYVPGRRLCKTNEPQSELYSKRITRATEKRLALKLIAGAQKHENLRSKKTPTQSNKMTPEMSVIPINYQFKPPVGIMPLPMFGRQALEGINDNMKLDLCLINASSSNSNISKNLSNSSDNYFSSSLHSSVNNRDLNKSKCNRNNSSTPHNKSFNNLSNNSSVEPISLKLSPDDSSFTKSTRLSENRRRSLKNIGTKIKIDMVLMDDQENVDDQSNTDFNLSDQSKTINKSSTKFRSILENKKVKNSNETEQNNEVLLDESISHYSLRQRVKKHSVINSSTLTEVIKIQNLSHISHVPSSCSDSPNVSVTSENTKTKKFCNKKDNLQSSDSNMSRTEDSTPEKPLAIFSPYIVKSRGKNSARKEVQSRRFSQISPKEIPVKSSIMQSLNISGEEEQQTAQYYKYILNQEVDRLNNRCDLWKALKEDDVIPEEIRSLINAAVGQTKLLINKKFERFRSLVRDCETGKGEMLVTCKDLQGFWDMMYMEIIDCDNRFSKLEGLKQKNWIIEESKDIKEVKQLRNKKCVPAKTSIKKKTASAKPSSLKAHIAAARMKQLSNKNMDIDVEITKGTNVSSDKYIEVRKSLMNDASIESSPRKIGRRTSTPKSSSKSKLGFKKLTQNKNSTSPLIMMKLSKMSKTPEVNFNSSIAYINSDRTPAKSILKTTKDDLIKDNNKINSYNTINSKNDSFNSSHIEVTNENINQMNLSHPFEHNPTKDTLNSKTEPSSKSATKSKKQISFEDNADSRSWRTDRSRKFSMPLRSRLNLRNSMNKVDESLNMEMDGTIQEYIDDSPISVHQKRELKELYLNTDGVICQRIVSYNKSEVRKKNKQYDKGTDLTPTIQNLKLTSSHESFIDTELMENNVSISVETITKTKVKRTPKAFNRKNSMNEIDSIGSAKKNSRTSSEPVKNKLNLEKNSKYNVTPNLTRRHSKRIQENIESTYQETNQNFNRGTKRASFRKSPAKLHFTN